MKKSLIAGLVIVGALAAAVLARALNEAATAGGRITK